MAAFNLRRSRRIKQAVHGRGDGWTEVGPGGIPGYSSPTMNWAPEFGGRWRENFPGGGSSHMDDDSDKQKNLRGGADDADPAAKREKINDRINLRPVDDDAAKGTFVITYPCKGEENPKELAKRLSAEHGVEAKPAGSTVVIMTGGGFDEAIQLQRKIPGSVLERKGGGK